jgi:hypothetical protein
MDDYMRTLSIEKKCITKLTKRKRKEHVGNMATTKNEKEKKMILMTEQESNKAYR